MGYIAKVSAVERLAGGRVTVTESVCELEITFAARDGQERYSITFPGSYQEALDEAVGLLSSFAPSQSCVHPRRLYDRQLETAYGGRDGHQNDDAVSPDHPHLEDLILRAGGHDAVLAVAAAAPASSNAVGPGLVLTDSRLLLFPGAKKKGGARAIDVPIEATSSAEITQSLVGCRFEIFVPSGDGVKALALEYEYPDSAQFMRAFTLLRHLLGQPSLPA